MSSGAADAAIKRGRRLDTLRHNYEYLKRERDLYRRTLRALVKSRWEHRCADGVDGRTAVSAALIQTAERLLDEREDAVTDLEAQALDKVEAACRTLRNWFQGTHYVNVQIRRNGKDEVREADWLRYLPDAIETEIRRVRAEALALKTVKDEHPAPHHRYVVKRRYFTFVATPCYGMHAPWWVPMSPTGETDPIPFEESDEWRALAAEAEPAP